MMIRNDTTKLIERLCEEMGVECTVSITAVVKGTYAATGDTSASPRIVAPSRSLSGMLARRGKQ